MIAIEGPSITFAILAALCGAGAYFSAEEAFFTADSIWDDPSVVSAVVIGGCFAIMAIIAAIQREKHPSGK